MWVETHMNISDAPNMAFERTKFGNNHVKWNVECGKVGQPQRTKAVLCVLCVDGGPLLAPYLTKL